MTALSPVAIDRFELPHPRGEGVLRISVAPPEAPAKEGERAAVLFVLDGDLGFAMAAEVVRFIRVGERIPPVIVVGIGYGVGFAEFAKLRTPDLTPPSARPEGGAPREMAFLIGEAQGSADAFLSFLTDTLAPEIARRYPDAVTDRRFLFGHSLAGLFASYALLTRPESFSGFVASSPSLWWDGFAVLAHLEAFGDRLKALAAPPRVLVAVGGQEQDLPTQVPAGMPIELAQLQAIVAASRMVDAAAEFAGSLRAAGLAHVEHARFDGEDHTTVVPAALVRGLSAMLTPG